MTPEHPPKVHPEVHRAAVEGILLPGQEPATVDGLRLRKVLGRKMWRPPQRYGPDGWRMDRHDQTGHVLVSTSPFPMDNWREWTHASISYADAMPMYEDLVLLHEAVWGDTGWAYQVFAPAGDHINLHAHALHLWGRADGARVLPDFAAEFGSI